MEFFNKILMNSDFINLPSKTTGFILLPIPSINYKKLLKNTLVLGGIYVSAVGGGNFLGTTNHLLNGETPLEIEKTMNHKNDFFNLVWNNDVGKYGRDLAYRAFGEEGLLK